MKLEQFFYLTNKLIDDFNLLQFLDAIYKHSFVILLNTCNMTNNNILDLKNELVKYDSKSIVIKAKYIEILFSNHFDFLKSSCMFIFVTDIIKFNNIIKLFNNNTPFLYSFDQSFSCITNLDTVLYQQNIYGNYMILHYIIFKLINNIILLLLLYIMLFVKLIANTSKLHYTLNESF